MNKRIYFTLLFLTTLFSGWAFRSFGQEHNVQSILNSDSSSVAKTLDKFIKAFTTLNWSDFTECFADDVTAFFPPSAKFPYRANNKAEVNNIFRAVFENARKQKSEPPYLDIQPKDLKIQMLGPVAIVTFLLEDPDLLGRRTIVLKKDKLNWRIVHLHASGIIIPK